MKLRALGKVGEFCSEASVPIIAGREKVIGFRQLEYAIYRKGILKKEVLPKTKGWVYCTDHRILMMDDGWVTQDGATYKRYHEVGLREARWVRYKLARIVWVDFVADEQEYTIAYVPYGAAARLFAWLQKEKVNLQKYADGELESPYAKDRWYRHPPK